MTNVPSKVSIIVPVYNVENYLAKCLDSLVNQSLQNIEILVVNDGSKDDSEKLFRSMPEISRKNKSFYQRKRRFE
jgi:glycosyltransferase involved in cell wall biosynthesis